MSRILIACEFSGRVRAAFQDMGHEAWSCDLLASEEGNTGYHLQGDVFQVANLPVFDLMIAHPPCTYLCNSGVRWLAPGSKLDPERHKLMQKGCDFFAALYQAPIARVAIENPLMHKYARDYLWSAWKVPAYSQKIQPWMFGHGETKATCLWLKNLPPLQPTHRKDDLFAEQEPVEREQRLHKLPPSPERWKERSRTFAGIARAMAQQWGALTTEATNERQHYFP